MPIEVEGGDSHSSMDHQHQVLRGSFGYSVDIGGSGSSHSSMGYQVLKKGVFEFLVGWGPLGGGIQCMQGGSWGSYSSIGHEAPGFMGRFQGDLAQGFFKPHTPTKAPPRNKTTQKPPPRDPPPDDSWIKDHPYPRSPSFEKLSDTNIV